jgi:hypothetical protein
MSDGAAAFPGEGRTTAQRLSPVVRALRFAGEEVQFGSVLEALCQDSRVAEAFAAAVVGKSKGGNAAARRRVRRKHGDVSCLGEQRLQVRLTRRGAAARAKDVGRVDLKFVDPGDWRLAIELKLGAEFGYKQLERYATWGPVAAVVRDLNQVLDADELRSNDNWVGAVTWRALLPDLRTLPVTEPWDREWLSLLEVAESDGDFDQGIPTRPEVDAQRDLLRAISPRVFEHLVHELRSKYRGSADPAIRGLQARPVTQDRVSAGFVISGADGAWLYIAIRNLFADHPRLRIDYYTFDDRRARRRLSDAHARIVKRGFKPVNNYYRFDQPVELLRGGSAANPDDAVAVISGCLSNLVRAKVFDVEIERLGRDVRRRHS